MAWWAFVVFQEVYVLKPSFEFTGLNENKAFEWSIWELILTMLRCTLFFPIFDFSNALMFFVIFNIYLFFWSRHFWCHIYIRLKFSYLVNINEIVQKRIQNPCQESKREFSTKIVNWLKHKIAEAAVCKCSLKLVFLKIWQNSQENTRVGVSF